MDTFTTLWNRVLLRAPALGPDLAQDYVRDAFNQLVERREWSWTMKNGSFYAPVFTAPGTVSIISGSATVNGSGTAFTSDMTGRQIRVGSVDGSSYPAYTILTVVSSTQLTIDLPWSGPSQAAQSYTIYQCYFPVPDDFQYFVSVVNPTGNYRLNTLATQQELDSYDPQRSQSGIAFALAFYEFSKVTQGIIGSTVQVKGSGAVPVSTTTLGFSYPASTIYSIEITTGGIVGTAQFSWSQDGVAGAAGIVSDGSPLDLSNGVQVYFPAGTYVLGDIFVIPCVAQTTSGVARYELWPRPVGAPYTYPFKYRAVLPALTDDQPQLPAPLARRGDVLVEMCMVNAALFPGTESMPNPYHDIPTSNAHRAAAERLIYELEKKDDDTATKDLMYQELPFMGPWNDGSWLQTHAMYPG